MRPWRVPALLLAAAAACGCFASRPATTVRAELEAVYEVNRQAFFRKDLEAIMALRTPDFHTVTADGKLQDRAAMEHYIQGILNGIDRWIDVTFEIQRLEVVGDEARATVRQHADRMALRPDGKVHHVETWVTQRETWRRTAAGWRMARVDSLRDQRRIIDGVPG